VPADELAVALDCGMKYLPRAACAKMKALALGGAIVRREIAGG
jgi:5-methyltetrahydropteroyltriglutamate--homocysteine methyltransferase